LDHNKHDLNTGYRVVAISTVTRTTQQKHEIFEGCFLIIISLNQMSGARQDSVYYYVQCLKVVKTENWPKC
jgi:hypothetical protein